MSCGEFVWSGEGWGELGNMGWGEESVCLGRSVGWPSTPLLLALLPPLLQGAPSTGCDLRLRVGLYCALRWGGAWSSERTFFRQHANGEGVRQAWAGVGAVSTTTQQELLFAAIRWPRVDSPPLVSLIPKPKAKHPPTTVTRVMSQMHSLCAGCSMREMHN